MNNSQKNILVCGLIAFILSVSFPPWISTYTTSTTYKETAAGYSFIAEPPKNIPTYSSRHGVKIDITRLLVQSLGIFIAMGIGLLLYSNKKKFLDDDELEEFDFEGAISKYIRELPVCSSKIVLSCKEYKLSDYNCKITIPAKDLLPWAEEHANSVSGGDDYEQTARLALPVYLRAANTSDPQETTLSFNMFKVVNSYIPNFIENGSANVFCYSCNSIINDIDMRGYVAASG